jgi:hypothetical protein
MVPIQEEVEWRGGFHLWPGFAWLTMATGDAPARMIGARHRVGSSDAAVIERFFKLICNLLTRTSTLAFYGVTQNFIAKSNEYAPA